MKQLGLILIGLTLLGSSLLPVVPVRAENELFEYRLSHRFDVRGELAAVRHEVTVRNRSRQALETLELALPVAAARDIAVTYPSGDTIPFTTVKKRSSVAGHEFEHLSLVLDFPRAQSGTDTSWQFQIGYETDEGVYSSGNSHVLLWPFLDGRISAAWEAEVLVPRDWPTINYRPNLRGSQVSADYSRLQLDSRDYDYPLLALSFAEDVVHQVSSSQRIRNRSLLPRLVSVVVPLDLHSQEVELTSLRPTPDRVTVDSDGNVVASWRLAPFQSKTVSWQAQVVARQYRYDMGEAGLISETPEELAVYTRSGRYWPTQSPVGERATALIDPEADSWANITAMLDFVEAEIAYSQEPAPRIPADAVLAAGSGTAEQIADLLVTMLRSQGIAARTLYGFAYGSSGFDRADANPHVWTEAYVPGVGWAHLDPVWSQLFGSRGSIGSDRIGLLAVGGDQQHYLSTGLPASVRLTPTEEELSPPEPAAALEATITSYYVVPGVAVYREVVTNQSGYAVDDIILGRAAIGSLAPYGSHILQQWRFGGASTQPVVVVVDDTELTVTPTANWWPFAIIGGVALAGSGIFLYRRRMHGYLTRRLGGRRLS